MAISMEKESNQVIFEEGPGVRKIILNRPKKFNSLKHEMISQMLKKLKLYEDDFSINVVILKGNGKAFCAGGDVTGFIGTITFGHWSYGESFYRKQLSLDYVLGTYNKPVVALINGVVMGGGAGISMHSRFRIVTEKTIFAMPEALIGSRREYLGLTGARLDGSDMLACGLATHFVLSKDLASIENALEIAAASRGFNVSTIDKIVNKFSQKLDVTQNKILSRLDIINKCFSGETVEEILSRLVETNTNKEEKWIIDAINSMKIASPTSLKVFLRSIKYGRAQRLDQCLVREFKILCHFMRRELTNDFFEGSRAMLIDKDKNPRWVPSKLEEVKEEMVKKFFSNLDDEEWESLKLPTRFNVSNILASRL